MPKMFTVEEHVEERLPYSAETPVGKYAWTRGSREDMPLFKALSWANAEGAQLQELDGAVLIRAGRHEKGKNTPNANLDGSNFYQVVNTLWVAHRSKDGWTVSYCRLPNSDAGVKLAEEGYNLNRNGKQLILPLDDAVLHTMTDEAQKQGRVVPALDRNEIKVPLWHDYALDPRFIAAFGGKKHGQEVAAVNAAYLQDRTCISGDLMELTTADLEKILPKDDPRTRSHAVIRRVGLGIVDDLGSRMDDIGVVATNGFDVDGHARGVRGAREFSRN